MIQHEAKGTLCIDGCTKGRDVYTVCLHHKNMAKWTFLAMAIFSEVVATSSLKSSEGFTNLIPSLIVLVGYSAAFYFLSLTLNDIPLGIAYAIWSGAGIVGIAIVAMIFHEQNLDTGAMIGMGLVILGIIVMRTYSTMMLE
jgi:multidrug transporter EmrE-like cation transporter